VKEIFVAPGLRPFKGCLVVAGYQIAMSDKLIFVATFVSAIGCGLMGGVFFAFSVFVMKALTRLPPQAGIAAMQAINVTVLNPLFFIAFLGTAAGCFVLAAYSSTGVAWARQHLPVRRRRTLPGRHSSGHSLTRPERSISPGRSRSAAAAKLLVNDLLQKKPRPAFSTTGPGHTLLCNSSFAPDVQFHGNGNNVDRDQCNARDARGISSLA